MTSVMAPDWLHPPDDVNALVPDFWPRNVARGADGVLTVGGVRVDDLAREFGTPGVRAGRGRHACPVPRRSGTRSAGADVYYAGKAFLSKAIVRIVESEGLSLDVCSGGELATALAAGMPPERIGLHGNNKSVDELTRAVDAGVGRIIVDSFDEIDRLTTIARARGGARPRSC